MSRWTWCAVIVGYLLMISAVVFGIAAYRRHALATLDNPAARAEWQQWRTEAEEMSKTGPVRRRVPKSNEPPGLLLVRDSYIALVVGGVFFSTALYVLIVWILRGACSSSCSISQKP